MDQTVMSQMRFFKKHLRTSFGGNSYKALERTIWVKPHCPANSFLINVWEHQEIYEVSWKFVLDPWKRHICQTALPLGQNLLKKTGKIQQQVICVFYNSWSNFLKRQYGSTRIVPDSYFSKDAWNRNKTSFWWNLIKNPWEDNMGQTVISFEDW